MRASLCVVKTRRRNESEGRCSPAVARALPSASSIDPRLRCGESVPVATRKIVNYA